MNTHTQITPVQRSGQTALVSTSSAAICLELSGNDILNTSQGTLFHMFLPLVINPKFPHRNGSVEEHRPCSSTDEIGAAGGMTDCEQRRPACTRGSSGLLGYFFLQRALPCNAFLLTLKQGPSQNKIYFGLWYSVPMGVFCRTQADPSTFYHLVRPALAQCTGFPAKGMTGSLRKKARSKLESRYYEQKGNRILGLNQADSTKPLSTLKSMFCQLRRCAGA